MKQTDLFNKNSKHIEDSTWLNVKVKNNHLRVSVNFLKTQAQSASSSLSNQFFLNILKPNMPLEALRMYFCKSLNSELIEYISDRYFSTLKSFVIIDCITEPTLRYSNPMLYDIEPDSLVLFCWKCKHLHELVIIGYEILEINLIAIAKLRNDLKVFCVPMDCIIDLKYGNFVSHDQFVEDDDGDDIIIEYGFCRKKIIEKVSSMCIVLFIV